jgi:hypothetical protein
MHMSSIFDPTFKQVMEIMVEDERQEDESGEGAAAERQSSRAAEGEAVG